MPRAEARDADQILEDFAAEMDIHAEMVPPGIGAAIRRQVQTLRTDLEYEPA